MLQRRSACRTQLEALRRCQLPLQPLSFKPLTSLVRWELDEVLAPPRATRVGVPVASSAIKVAGNGADAIVSDAEEEGELPAEEGEVEGTEGAEDAMDYGATSATQQGQHEAAAQAALQAGHAVAAGDVPVDAPGAPSSLQQQVEEYVPQGLGRYTARFRRDGIEVQATILVSNEYPDFPSEWRLVGAWQLQQPGLLPQPPSSSPAMALTPTPGAAAAGSGGRLALHTCDPELAAALRAVEAELNVAVPARVPQAMLGRLLSYQLVALLRGLDAALGAWAAKHQAPPSAAAMPAAAAGAQGASLGAANETRGPDGHVSLPDSLL